MPKPSRLWAGSDEPIFGVLPGTVLDNFYNPHAENALLWNLIYPRAQPTLPLVELLGRVPLWGTPYPEELKEERPLPYYWGFGQDGSRLAELDDVLIHVDGPGPKTEIDLLLRGQRLLIAVEAKRNGDFGRCARYVGGRCPEVHGSGEGGDAVCRYWEPGAAQFVAQLIMGARPGPETLNPACNLHYQLARTLLIGKSLAVRLGLQFALWVFLPRKRWRALEKTWLDFTERVRDDQLWRMMRVLSWEQVEQIPPR